MPSPSSSKPTLRISLLGGGLHSSCTKTHRARGEAQSQFAVAMMVTHTSAEGELELLLLVLAPRVYVFFASLFMRISRSWLWSRFGLVWSVAAAAAAYSETGNWSALKCTFVKNAQETSPFFNSSSSSDSGTIVEESQDQPTVWLLGQFHFSEYFLVLFCSVAARKVTNVSKFSTGQDGYLMKWHRPAS